MYYKVLRFFYDLQDDNHAYDIGDTYPREGFTASEKRIAELTGDKNKQRMPLIEAVEEPKAKKETDEEKPKKRAKK